MAKKLEIGIDYLPTGQCKDCNEIDPDILVEHILPEGVEDTESIQDYVRNNLLSMLDQADQLIKDNYRQLFKTSEKQEWFGLIIRTGRVQPLKIRLVYGINRDDNTTRMCKKIHSGSNLLPLEEIEELVKFMWVDLPEPEERRPKDEYYQGVQL